MPMEEFLSLQPIKINAPTKRRLLASARLFSLESGVALSRTVVGTTFIQPSQTPTPNDTNTRVKLTIVTFLSFSERLTIANLLSFEFCVLVWLYNTTDSRSLPDIIVLTCMRIEILQSTLISNNSGSRS